MISSANTYGAQRQWSGYGGTLGSGSLGDLLNTSFMDMMRQAASDYDSFTERVKSSGSTVRLTAEQKRYLEENFDPRNMTKEEYRAFLDKLCEFGVIAREDLYYLGYGVPGSDMELVAPRDTMYAFITPHRENPMHYTSSFSSSRGNILDWATYLAGTTVWDEGTHSWQKRPEDILFGKIRDVLESISR